MKDLKLKTNPHFKSIEQFRRAIFQEESIPLYARGSNETVDELNKLMAEYEGKEAALSFSSGMGAISAVGMSLLKSGDHVLINKHSYSWARLFFCETLKNFGVTTELVEEKDLMNLEKFIKPHTKLIYVESPSYFYFEDLPLEHITSVAKKHKILSAIDNTHLGPGNLKHAPDFDLIIHSTTKIVGSHSDSLGGAVCTSKKLREKIFHDGLMVFGAMQSPFNAWLAIRGMQTYKQRCAWIATEVVKFAQFLESHPKIGKVNFPWSEKNHWTTKYANFPVGTLSFELKTTNEKEIENFCQSLKRVEMAVSYGGIEPIIMPAQVFAREGHDLIYPKNLIRFSIGLASAEECMEDFTQALK